MGLRSELHDILLTFTPHVYFQPPTNVQIQYPCIVYKRDLDRVKRADNSLYDRKIRYQVTVIDEDPDSTIPQMVAQMPLSAFNRHFTHDYLNHDVFSVYF